MVVDIAPQQQLTEVFTTNHNHHWSSSSSSSSTSSSTHRRSSATIPSTSSVTESASTTTMTNGYRSWSNELGRKAEQILGQPKAVLDCPRQKSIDFHAQHPPRLTITASKPSISSRNTLSNSTTVHNQSTIISSQSETSSGKTKQTVTFEHLVPFILQLVAAPNYSKVPEMTSRHRSNSKHVDTIMESREMTRILHEETSVKLSDDENEEDDDDNHVRNPNTVLTEFTDKKIDQTNSNDNQLLPHSYENQIEPPQHSGLSSSSRCQEDDDSEDDDSDNQEAVHSDAENDDDEANETNRDTLSLMDFIQAKEIPAVEPVEILRETPSNQHKRSISPEIKPDVVHNSEDHQNKRQKLLIKRTLLRSFMSSVNTKINFKNPSLPIAIPTHLFFEQSSPEDERSQQQRTSKRNAHGSVKQETNLDVTDHFSPLSSTNLIQQKKAKPSQIQEKNLPKQDAPISNKNEQINLSTTNSSNDTSTNSINRAPLQATVTPMINTQQKKEKPTANVKPLLQSTSIDNLSSSNSITNGINISDSLTTSNSRLILPSTKLHYAKLKSMSKTELDALARKKKKQADCGKRTTFAEAREAMGLYLESVCYFIQCANEESKHDQRTALLTTTLTMLQQLARNHKKMFQLSNSNHSVDLYNLHQKFLLINYWLQALIHHLQYQLTMASVDRYAGQVSDYFNQNKHPSATRMNNQQQQLTPVNDSNPLSPLSSSSDLSSTSANNDQNRSIYEFSKLMLNSYHSTFYWNKAEHLMKEKVLKEFTEQLLKQNQNQRLSRDGPTLDYLLYIFDSIELLRLSVA